ncbi:MAG: M6 family metalloprotease domain-containing protein, partial [Prevotellaceae bacterium]|nr:M6 family metalloprotease domain-containing protein [Prevotellaceae bacterium]
MRKTFLISFLLLCTINNIWGTPAFPYPINIVQQDGTNLTILLKGDEFFHWTETEDGSVIVRNNAGMFEYAEISDGHLMPANVKVHNLNQRDNAEIQYLQTISKEQIFQLLKSDREQVLQVAQREVSQVTNASNVTGTKKILCILMGFTDLPFSKTQTEFNNLMNQTGYNVGSAIGSVKDYYKEVSYNNLNLEITVAGPFIANHDMAYYGGNNSSSDDMRPRELITEAVQKANPYVNYANFDNDNNGTVDGVHIIFAGYDEAAGGSDNAIWSHKWTIPTMVLDGKSISTYSCSSELRWNYGNTIASIGTICHELGHVFGAPDFYDTDYSTNGQYQGTGQWDLMGNGSWNSGGDIPAHHNPYTKTQIYGWTPANNISSNITLYPAYVNSNSFYKINTNTTGEYFLIENRQQYGFDASLPGHGLLIWHIHKDIGNNNNNIAHPQKLYPVCASATQNPDNTSISYGSINNSSCPFPGSSNKRQFTSNTVLAAKAWNGSAANSNIYYIEELSNNITLLINPPTISGPTKLCSSGPHTYQVGNLPAGAAVAWQSGLGLSGTANGNTYSITPFMRGSSYVKA